MKIPSQEEADFGDPAEHLAWAMRSMPILAGIGGVIHPVIIRGWSEHLHAAGFRHVDAIAELADEDGNIHVSKLPKQTIKHQHAVRGPRHPLNNAATWVSMDTPAPPPMNIPDITLLTPHERAALLDQFKAVGDVPTTAVTPPLAEHE